MDFIYVPKMNPDCTPESLLESHLAAIHNMLRKNITKIPDHEIIDWSLKTAYEICHTRNTDATFFLELHTGLNRRLCDFGYLFPKVPQLCRVRVLYRHSLYTYLCRILSWLRWFASQLIQTHSRVIILHLSSVAELMLKLLMR